MDLTESATRRNSAAMDGKTIITVLRTYVFALPEVEEDFPGGESVAKIRGTVFVVFPSPDADGVFQLTLRIWISVRS